MTDTTRREFLKNLAKGTGTTLLTAGVVSSQKPQQRTVKKKVQTVKKVKKLGSKAKAYKKFLQSIQLSWHHENYQGHKGHRDVSPMTQGRKNTPRLAFEESITKKPKTYKGRHTADLSSDVLKHTEKYHNEWDKNFVSNRRNVEKNIREDARQILADEKNLQRWKSKKPKKVTKRGIYETIKNKLRKFKPRSGFGGPRPRKVGIGNQDPSRVSGYHY